MHLDLTVTLGNIISGAMCVAAVLGAHMRTRDRMVRIETLLEPLWKEFERRRIGRG